MKIFLVNAVNGSCRILDRQPEIEGMLPKHHDHTALEDCQDIRFLVGGEELLDESLKNSVIVMLVRRGSWGGSSSSAKSFADKARSPFRTNFTSVFRLLQF